MTEILNLNNIQPYIRFVNNYEPACSYTEKERIIFDYELMYVMDGEADIYYSGKLYNLKKSDIFYFRPFDKNFMIVDYRKHFRTHCIHFDWSNIDKKYDFTAEEFYMHSVLSANHKEKLELLKTRPCCEPIDFNIPTHIEGLSYEKYSALFSKCYYHFISSSVTAHLKLKSVFTEIIAEIYSDTVGYQDECFMHPKIKYAIQYIKSNYASPLTAPALAYMYGLSPKYFGSLFKKSTGMSVADFILKLRIDAAKEMLRGTAMTINEISERVGFDNSFYFSKCFKSQENLPPSQYRNLITEIGDLK